MLKESNLHNYQRAAVKHIINNPYCGLLLEMGLGKVLSGKEKSQNALMDEVKYLIQEYL